MIKAQIKLFHKNYFVLCLYSLIRTWYTGKIYKIVIHTFTSKEICEIWKTKIEILIPIKIDFSNQIVYVSLKISLLNVEIIGKNFFFVSNKPNIF